MAVIQYVGGGPVPIPSKVLGPRGPQGWTPVIRAEGFGPHGRVLFVDWEGGVAPKPATGYIGSSGLVAIDSDNILDFGARSVVSMAQQPDYSLLVTFHDGSTYTIPNFFADLVAKANYVAEKYPDIVNKHADVVGAHTDVLNQQAAVEAKRVEVNNVTAQAANIVFAGSTDFPTVPPVFSWHCDSGELDPRIDVSYAGNLSVTDQRGGLRSVPQGARALDYDPATRACLGFPIWESRTELLQSDTFQTGWGINGLASLPVQSTDTRFGSKFKLIPGDSASFQRVLNGNINLIGGQTYTATVIASAGEYRYLSIRIGSGTGLPPDYIVFDLINKTATTAVGLTTTIKDLGGGVVKCMLTGTATSSGGSNLYVGVSNTFTTNYSSWAGDGVSGLYVYRANFQAGAPDAPLLAGGTTRGAISAQIQGAAFQQMYNKYEGTWVIETGPLSATGVSRVILCQSDGVVGTATEISLVLHAAGELRLDVPINGDYSSGRIGIPVSSTTNNRIVFSYKGSVATMSVNGGAVVAKTYSLGIPTNATKAILGANRLFSTSLNERQREIAYYPVALPDAQLQALSRL